MQRGHTFYDIRHAICAQCVGLRPSASKGAALNELMDTRRHACISLPERMCAHALSLTHLNKLSIRIYYMEDCTLVVWSRRGWRS